MSTVFTEDTSNGISYNSQLVTTQTLPTDNDIAMVDASQPESPTPEAEGSRKRKTSPNATDASPEEERESALRRRGEKGPIKLKIKLFGISEALEVTSPGANASGTKAPETDAADANVSETDESEADFPEIPEPTVFDIQQSGEKFIIQEQLQRHFQEQLQGQFQGQLQ